jgi:hypothetical protein
MRNLNYFATFLLCPRCEKPFTVVSPDNIHCPYCNHAEAGTFHPLYSPTVRNLMELLEHVYASKESWRNQAVLMLGLSIFEALLSEVFQSFMDHKRLPWIFERPVIRHLPWQEKFDFLIEGAHLEDPSAEIKRKIKDLQDYRIQFLHGRAQPLHTNLYEEVYTLVGELVQLFAEIYFQMDLKPYFLQQIKDEARPLRRGSESQIAPPPGL